MYRKHLRMARGEGETKDAGLKSHFVERVVKLPMVHVAWDYATNKYSHLKDSNRLVNFTLTRAEKSVTFVAEQAKPVVLRFEKQIQAVDDLACKGLGTLEEKVPFITKPPEQILDDTKKLYTSTFSSSFQGLRNYGNEKIKTVTDYGLQKAVDFLSTPYGQLVIHSADGALNLTEKFVDHVIPSTCEECSDEPDKEKKQEKRDVITRVGKLSYTVRHRTYCHLASRLHNVQKRIQGLLPNPTGLIQYAKDNLDSTQLKLRTTVDSVNNYANHVWEELNKEEPKSQEGSEKTLEQQIMSIARAVAKQLVVAYATAASILPGRQEADQPETAESDLARSPIVVTAVKNRLLQVVGIILLVPSLLPMYLYAFAVWLDSKKSQNRDHEEEKEQTKENIQNQSNEIAHEQS